MRPGAARSTSRWPQKMLCLEIQTTYTAVPGYLYTRYQAYSSFFLKAGTRRRVRRRPRPLPSIGHNVGPSWSTFKSTRWSQRSATARRSTALEIVKSWKGVPKSCMLTLHDFSGAVKFHELRQNASAFREKIHEYGKKKVRRNSGPYSLKIANLTTPLLLLLLPPRVTPPPIAFPPEYKPGQGIMPHTDGPFYAPRTATLSVGSDAVMHFSPRVAAADIGRPGVDARPLSSLVLKRRCLVVFADGSVLALVARHRRGDRGDGRRARSPRCQRRRGRHAGGYGRPETAEGVAHVQKGQGSPRWSQRLVTTSTTVY